MITSNTQLQAAALSGDQTCFQFIPKDVVRAAREAYRQELEKKEAARPLWKKLLGI